jgi:hypothetical protein
MAADHAWRHRKVRIGRIPNGFGAMHGNHNSVDQKSKKDHHNDDRCFPQIAKRR